MNTTEYAPVVKKLTAILAVLGLWVIVAPFLLPNAELVLLHAIAGVIVAAIAGGYSIQLHRKPDTKIASIWFVLLLGIILLVNVLLRNTSEPTFWNIIVTSILIILLALISIYWASRFGASDKREMTIFE